MSTATTETYTCMERVYAGTVLEPAEYCDNEVAEEEAFCEQHGGEALEDAQERVRQAWKDGDR